MRPSRIHIDACWAVPFISACATFLFAMPKANSGVFFVFFVGYFGVDRETASWPETVESATGFVIGAVLERVSVFSIIAAGAFLCPVSMVAAAFAPDMTWMSVTFGFLYGASRGLLMIGTSIYTVSYFDQYRGIASGIRITGVSLTGIIGPSLLAQLAKTYHFQGCLLITGGLMLNLIPLLMMLRNPRPVACSKCWRCGTSQHTKSASVAVSPATTTAAHTMQPPTTSVHLVPERHLKCGKYNDEAEADTTPSKAKHNSCHRPLRKPPGLPIQLPKVSDRREGPNAGIATQTLTVLTTPSFYIIMIAVVAADFTLPLLGTTIVDYALDKKLAPDESWRLVTFLFIGAMFGHLVIPLLSDKLARGRSLIAALSFTLLSLSFILMPQVGSFAAVGAVTVLGGVQHGYLNTLKPVLVADYLGVGSVAVSWGLMGLASLPLTVCEPMIVGAFRDNGGSYDRLYRLCSVVSLLAASLLVLQSCLDARKRSAKFETAPLPSAAVCTDIDGKTSHSPK
ncbi:monocarboxylate transporter 14-like isoform X2 [Dermacentor albipictus]|uniref:monocarboxylate transporter 14-like isoform X2 n=1 Tax=Dermacentor albipictus TaxID=60249 RepID=UPI0038FC4B4D